MASILLPLISLLPAGLSLLPAVELLGPSPVSFPVDAGPEGLATADLNGDGALDIVVAAKGRTGVGGGTKLNVLLGDGSGGFTRAPDVTAGVEPVAIAVSHFNGDSHQDLAVVNLAGDTVSILLGDGKGGFSAAPDLTTGPGPASVAVGDFDEDMNIDLVVANRGALAPPFNNTISLYLGDGNGGFSRQPDITVGSAPFQVVVARVDGNSHDDILVPNAISGTFSLLLGDGLGAFSISDVPVAQFVSALAVGDYDKNGTVDVAAGYFFGGVMSIRLGDGMGGFAPAPDVAVVNSPRNLATSDFNQDGRLDLAASNFNAASVSLLFGDGTGAFSSTEFQTGDFPTGIVAGDFNGDGIADLGIANSASSSVTVLKGDGIGSFVSTPQVPTGLRPGAVEVVDFNHDGAFDLAVAELGDVSDPNVDAVVLLTGHGDGVFTRTDEVAVADGPNSMAAADFNRDGRLDLAVANGRSDSLSILLGNGSGGFTKQNPDLAAGDLPHSVAVGKFDRGRALDLAVVNRNDSSLTIYLGDGEGHFTGSAGPSPGTEPVTVVAARLNDDTFHDLAVTNVDANTITVLLNDGFGNFTPGQVVPVGAEPWGLAAVDFDGNGTNDMAATNAADSTVTIIHGDGLGGFTVVDTVPVGRSPRGITTGDLNDDGLVDLAVATHFGDTASILLNDGNGSFFPATELLVGLGPTGLAAEDLNGDGVKDLVVVNTDSDNVSVLMGTVSERGDLNGSNRTDGFDIAAIGRGAGCAEGDPCYRRTVDINLDRTIDGDDIALAAHSFGQIIRTVPPLSPSLGATSPATSPNTVTFQSSGRAADVLRLQIVVDDNNDPVAAADFAVAFDPELLEYEGFVPGQYLAGGGSSQIYDIDDRIPGRIGVGISRFPTTNIVGSGPAVLMEILLRALRVGQTSLDFEAFNRSVPEFLDGSGAGVPGIGFASGASVSIGSSTGGLSVQRIALAPSSLAFGPSAAGATSLLGLRVSNAGLTELRVFDISSTEAAFQPYFSEEFRLSPFAFVELTVAFTPPGTGPYSGELVIQSDDPATPEVRIPLNGDGL